jgi:AcrR family transcriptional regulator
MLDLMVRWEPGTRSRLQAAAMDLFVRHGFEQTTAAEIAAEVGLSERTFFRHFVDKREVLFDGQHLLEEAFLDGVAAAEPDASPMRTIESALDAAAAFFSDERRSWSVLRQTIIDANPPLQERELLKLAGVARVMASALRDRGVPADAAALAAESGLTVFGVAFQAWVSPGETRSFRAVVHDVLATLGAVVADA